MVIITQAKLRFNWLIITLIFGIWACAPLPGPGERLKRPGLVGLKQTREKRFTICSRQNHTHIQLQPTAPNIGKSRLSKSRARLLEPQEIILQLLTENKAIFNNNFFGRLCFYTARFFCIDATLLYKFKSDKI